MHGCSAIKMVQSYLEMVCFRKFSPNLYTKICCPTFPLMVSPTNYSFSVSFAVWIHFKAIHPPVGLQIHLASNYISFIQH